MTLHKRDKELKHIHEYYTGM